MAKVYSTKICCIGNSQGVRIPKALLAQLGTTEVTLEQTKEGILIKPSSATEPPLEKWMEIMSKLQVQEDTELQEWKCIINDGLENEPDFPLEIFKDAATTKKKK